MRDSTRSASISIIGSIGRQPGTLTWRRRAPCTSAYRKLDTECRHRRKVKMIRPARLPVTLPCRRYLLRHLHRRRQRLHVVLGPKRRVNAHRRRLLETLLLAGVAS